MVMMCCPPVGIFYDFNRRFVENGSVGILVSSIVFNYPNDNLILGWDLGAAQFFGMNDLFERGHLTRDHIRSIACRYGDATMPGGYLDPETEKQIKQGYLDIYIEKMSGQEYFEEINELDHIWIAGYYGTYNGYAAVMVYHGREEHPAGGALLVIQVIAGEEFVYGYGPPHHIVLWKDGSFHGSLRDAYNQGLLDQDDVKIIAGIYRIIELDFCPYVYY